MLRAIGNYILIPHKLHQLFVQYRLKEYHHQLGITLFQMVKLAKIGYVRVRSERDLTVSRKLKISFFVTVNFCFSKEASLKFQTIAQESLEKT